MRPVVHERPPGIVGECRPVPVGEAVVGIVTCACDSWGQPQGIETSAPGHDVAVGIVAAGVGYSSHLIEKMSRLQLRHRSLATKHKNGNGPGLSHVLNGN